MPPRRSFGGRPETAGELHQRFDPGHPVAALKEADLGPVDRGAEREFFLREVGLIAQAPQVRGEARGHGAR
jgi:hypothetical protein